MTTSTAPRLLRSTMVSLTCLAVFAGCSGSGDAVSDGSDDSTAVEAPSDESESDDSSAPDNGELPGSLVIEGALSESFDAAADDVLFRPGGSCQSGAFVMSMKVDLSEITQFDVIVGAEGVDPSSRSGVPVEFETYAYDLESGNFDPEIFAGSGTLTIVDQQEFQTSYNLTGTLAAKGDESREITVDLDGSLPLSCS